MFVRGCMLLLIIGVAAAAADLFVTSRPVYVRFGQQDRPYTAAKSRQEEASALPDSNGRRNIDTNQESAAGVELGGDFLKLFDEIWRIKRLSLNAIAENQEFAEQAKQQRQPYIASTSPATTTEENSDIVIGPDETSPPNLLSTTVSMGFGLPQKPFKLLQRQQVNPQASVKQHASGNSLLGQLGAWLHQLNIRISKTLQMARISLQSQRQLGTANVVDNVESIQDDTDSSIVRKRRQTQLQEREAPETDQSGCVRLNQEQMNECRFAELQVGTVMNSSFPATPAAIEDNCRHVTFLLSNCWPEQLQLIRLAVSSGGWNESLLQTSTFQLPTQATNNGEQVDQQTVTTSCGLRPQLPDSVLDRISWMWLNFCMDKKFRRDYLDHLRCLSFWSQDRAHAVCHDQWRLIQNGPNNALLSSAKQRVNIDKQKKTLQFAPLEPTGEVMLTTTDYTLSLLANATTTAGATGSAAASGRHMSQELQTRDLESKTLCCMFDLFLRCVHRQALRDCGRSGAQLVVNFMARIGTDDMKWVCNAGNIAATGSASKARPPQQGGSRRNSHNNSVSLSAPSSSAEQSLGPSPFIERSYCNDPKISQALRVQSSHGTTDDSNKFPGNDHHHYHRNKPAQGGRTNTRGPMQGNNNPLQDVDDAELGLKDSTSSLHHPYHHLLLLVISIAHYLILLY